MDKQLIEKIALEVADVFPGKAISYKNAIEFAHRFLSRIDAERGRCATAWLLDVPNGCLRLDGFIGESQKCDGLWKPLFLSPTPTIPEGWISTKDRLPKDFEEVLCSFTDGTVRVLEFNTHPETRFINRETGGWWILKVTHWMPLPAAAQ